MEMVYGQRYVVSGPDLVVSSILDVLGGCNLTQCVYTRPTKYAGKKGHHGSLQLATTHPENQTSGIPQKNRVRSSSCRLIFRASVPTILPTPPLAASSGTSTMFSRLTDADHSIQLALHVLPPSQDKFQSNNSGRNLRGRRVHHGNMSTALSTRYIDFIIDLRYPKPEISNSTHPFIPLVYYSTAS